MGKIRRKVNREMYVSEDVFANEVKSEIPIIYLQQICQHRMETKNFLTVVASGRGDVAC